MAEEKVGLIYEITCLKTNKNYIGRSIYIAEYRLKQHFEHSRSTSSDSYYNPLQVDMRKYGEKNFSIRELGTFLFKKRSELNKIEQSYIKEHNTLFPNGYNVSGLKGKEFTDYQTYKKKVVERGC